MGVIAAHVDDTFSISVEGSQWGFTNNSIKLKISRDDIQSANVTLDFTLEKKPAKTALLPNYPNPFNPETWIPYQLRGASEVVIRIYNAQGQLVRVLIWDIEQPVSTLVGAALPIGMGKTTLAKRSHLASIIARLKPMTFRRRAGWSL